ncbi:hypothetical protein J26TS2_12730 [Shouchella clausii]|nr:hypothetical protein J26TS2_12730 [Shouchella clausii]
MNNKSDLIDEGAKEFSFSVALNMLQHGAKELLKGYAPNIVGDGVASLIPGVYGAYSAVKRKRFEDNMQRMFEQLGLKYDILNENYNKKNAEQKAQLDKIYGLIMDYVIEEPQLDKVDFIINGFENLFYYDHITEDFVLTYYDVLKSLRLVDISTLKIFKTGLGDQTAAMTMIKVMEHHEITSEQYKSVKKNLLRLGLLTTQVDINYYENTEKLYKHVAEIQKYLKVLSDSKRKNTPKLSEPKFKTKEDRYQITKFGREFLDFFVEKESL